MRSLEGAAGVREAVRSGGADDPASNWSPAISHPTTAGRPRSRMKKRSATSLRRSRRPGHGPRRADRYRSRGHGGLLRAARRRRARVVLSFWFRRWDTRPRRPRLHRSGLDRPGHARAAACRAPRRSPGVPPGTSSRRRRRRPARDDGPDIIAGPSLVPSLRSSSAAFKAIIEGTMPRCHASVSAWSMSPRRRRAHHSDRHSYRRRNRYLLLTDGPTITWLGLAQVLRDHLGLQPTRHDRQVPGKDPSPLTIRDDRAKRTRLASPPGRDDDRRTAGSLSDPASGEVMYCDARTVQPTGPVGPQVRPHVRSSLGRSTASIGTATGSVVVKRKSGRGRLGQRTVISAGQVQKVGAEMSSPESSSPIRTSDFALTPLYPLVLCVPSHSPPP